VRTKYYYIITVFCFSIISLYAAPLHALGIGFYTTGKAGVALWNTGKNGTVVNYGLGAGFVLDTAVASNELFNYRLNAGYENVIESGFPFFKKYSVNRITVSNAFGFGVVRIKYLRVWVGPQVELGCQFIKTSEHELEVSPLYISYLHNSIDYALFTIGIGAVLGININPGELFTMSFELGLNTFMGVGRYHVGKYSLNFGNLPGHTASFFPTVPSSSAYDRAFGKVEGLARLSFIFRIEDNYLPDIIQ
jgi:hypothetical protein